MLAGGAASCRHPTPKCTLTSCSVFRRRRRKPSTRPPALAGQARARYSRPLEGRSDNLRDCGTAARKLDWQQCRVYRVRSYWIVWRRSTPLLLPSPPPLPYSAFLFLQLNSCVKHQSSTKTPKSTIKTVKMVKAGKSGPIHNRPRPRRAAITGFSPIGCHGASRLQPTTRDAQVCAGIKHRDGYLDGYHTSPEQPSPPETRLAPGRAMWHPCRLLPAALFVASLPTICLWTLELTQMWDF